MRMTKERAIEILTIDAERASFFEVAEAVDLAVDALKEQIDRKWIPCSERLPDKHGVYLVTGENGHVFEYDYSDFTTHNEKWSYCGNEIVAWRPLPEPYKKEGDLDA